VSGSLLVPVGVNTAAFWSSICSDLALSLTVEQLGQGEAKTVIEIILDS
jgi:hypothetical protein